MRDPDQHRITLREAVESAREQVRQARVALRGAEAALRSYRGPPDVRAVPVSTLSRLGTWSARAVFRSLDREPQSSPHTERSRS